MENYAQMSSRGFQSPTNVRLHYVLASRLRRIEGRLVEEVNQMLVDGLGLDGKKKGTHPPADSTARGWVRRFSDLPEKTYRSPADAQNGILPEFLPYWGTDEFHARQDHRNNFTSQGVRGLPALPQNQSGASSGPSLSELVKAVCAGLACGALVGSLLDEIPRKAGGSHYQGKLTVSRTQWRNIQMRGADLAKAPPERDNSGILAHARSRRQAAPGSALARLRAARGLD